VTRRGITNWLEGKLDSVELLEESIPEREWYTLNSKRLKGHHLQTSHKTPIQVKR